MYAVRFGPPPTDTADPTTVPKQALSRELTLDDRAVSLLQSSCRAGS